MASDDDTIFALSSGRPPAAIAVIRVSGSRASAAMTSLVGRAAPPRRAVLRALRDQNGSVLDHALLLWFPGPATATGEDLLELHCHGGRAVIAAVETALSAMPGLRPATPGEFTRRALLHGRIDLAQAEGLGDLLVAETETQRRFAIRASEGLVSRQVAAWMQELSAIGALLELSIDHDDEDADAAGEIDAIGARLERLRADMRQVLAQPAVERLRDGLRVVIAGPRNAGKSSLFNALIDRDGAIISPIAGTTRDTIEASVSRGGHAFLFSDTAGLVDTTEDVIEAIGIERARAALDHADLILWLDGPKRPTTAAADIVFVHSRADVPGRTIKPDFADIAVSIIDPCSIAALWGLLGQRAEQYVSLVDRPLLNMRQRTSAIAALDAVEGLPDDQLLIAEHVRIAAGHLAGLLGIDATETMLDALFGGFCIGK